MNKSAQVSWPVNDINPGIFTNSCLLKNSTLLSEKSLHTNGFGHVPGLFLNKIKSYRTRSTYKAYAAGCVYPGR